jgi:hypothetical protein
VYVVSEVGEPVIGPASEAALRGQLDDGIGVFLVIANVSQRSLQIR